MSYHQYGYHFRIGYTSKGPDSKVKSSYTRDLAKLRCPKCNNPGCLRPMWDKPVEHGECKGQRLEAGAYCGSCKVAILKPWFVETTDSSKEEVRRSKALLEREKEEVRNLRATLEREREAPGRRCGNATSIVK